MEPAEFQALLMNNYVVVQMIPDGAVSQALFGMQDFHMHVRNRAIMQIESNMDHYAAFMEQDELELHRMEGTWADETTIFATAGAFNINIMIIRPPVFPLEIRGPEGANETIHVSYHHQHYNLLEPFQN